MPIWNWAPDHIPYSSAPEQWCMSKLQASLNFLFYSGLCATGVPDFLDSRFQYSQCAPMSIIRMIKSSFNPFTMRTVILTSFLATYTFMRYLPVTFIAPLFALHNAARVSGNLVGWFFTGFFLIVAALIQLTSAPVSYRALTVNEFLI